MFSKDLPLTRANISHKSYLTFQDHDTVELNHNLINQKVECTIVVIVSPAGLRQTGSCAFGGFDPEDDEGFGAEDWDRTTA